MAACTLTAGASQPVRGLRRARRPAARRAVSTRRSPDGAGRGLHQAQPGPRAGAHREAPTAAAAAAAATAATTAAAGEQKG